MSKQILVAWVLLAITLAWSPSSYELPNLEAGSAHFSINSKSNIITTSAYQHTFATTFTALPNVAYSLQFLGVQTGSITEWTVKTNLVTITKLTVHFRHQPQYWSICKAGFIASARQDILVGAITADFNGLKQNTVSVFVNFSTPNPNFNVSIARAFLSGFTMKSGSQIFIRAFDKGLSINRAELAVQVGGSMEISSAQVNYIIFSPKTSSFASYGGGVNEINLSQSKLYNIQKIIHYSSYKFYGIANLRQSSQAETLLFSQIDDEFYLRVDNIKPTQQFYISYIILGVAPAQACAPNTQQRMINGKECLDGCPSGSYALLYNDGGRGCRRCPNQYNMIVNGDGNGCACKQGFVDRKGYCVNGQPSGIANSFGIEYDASRNKQQNYTLASLLGTSGSPSQVGGVTAAIKQWNSQVLVPAKQQPTQPTISSTGSNIRNTNIVANPTTSTISSSSSSSSSSSTSSSTSTSTSTSLLNGNINEVKSVVSMIGSSGNIVASSQYGPPQQIINNQYYGQIQPQPNVPSQPQPQYYGQKLTQSQPYTQSPYPYSYAAQASNTGTQMGETNNYNSYVPAYPKLNQQYKQSIIPTTATTATTTTIASPSSIYPSASPSSSPSAAPSRSSSPASSSISVQPSVASIMNGNESMSYESIKKKMLENRASVPSMAVPIPVPLSTKTATSIIKTPSPSPSPSPSPPSTSTSTPSSITTSSSSQVPSQPKISPSPSASTIQQSKNNANVNVVNYDGFNAGSNLNYYYGAKSNTPSTTIPNSISSPSISSSVSASVSASVLASVPASVSGLVGASAKNEVVSPDIRVSGLVTANVVSSTPVGKVGTGSDIFDPSIGNSNNNWYVPTAPPSYYPPDIYNSNNYYQPTQTQSQTATSYPSTYPSSSSSSSPSPPSSASSASYPSYSSSSILNWQYKMQDCSGIDNSYWTGYRCTCKVGYLLVDSICANNTNRVHSTLMRPAQFIYKISQLYQQTCTLDNQRYDGQTCVCMSGCTRINGRCTPNQDTYPNHNSNNNNNNNNNGYNNDWQQQYKKCPSNSYYSNSSQSCVCTQGYTMSNRECRPKQCPQYSYDNGYGQCICNNGYTLDNNRCISRCGPYSSPDPRTRECKCVQGYYLYNNNVCTQCPQGQISIENKCQHICGINEFYNPSTQTCECVAGYAIYQQVCQMCPDGFVAVDGFCATCPIMRVFDQYLRKCLCATDFDDIKGVCVSKCGINEVYDANRKQCRCRQGLARINGRCAICYTGFVDPLTQVCSTQCNIRQMRTPSGKCVCQPQYGYGPNNLCISCQQLQGGYLINGYCGTCPTNSRYINGKCTCDSGMNMINGRCMATCRNGQLIDVTGYCYYCPISEEPKDGVCVCQPGLIRVNGVCKMNCGEGRVEIQGVCAVCVLGTIYNPVTKACICPRGTFMNSYGICEPYISAVPVCDEGKYYSTSSYKCELCPQGCRSCTNASTCIRCQLEGFYPQGPTCMSRCGDGIQTFNQRCDDGNLACGDGCSNLCQIQNGFNCAGTKPSICTMMMAVCGDGVVSGAEQCDDKNYMRGDGCFACVVQNGWTCPNNICYRLPINNYPAPRNPIQNGPTPSPPTIYPNLQPNSPNPTPSTNPTQAAPQTPPPPVVVVPAPVTQMNLKVVGQAYVNMNNVFVILETPNAYKFQSQSQMKSFMKYKFVDSGTDPSSAYCMQRAVNPKIYECLVIYASGVPNKKFSIYFSYNYQGEVGYTTAIIDPFKSILRTRSLK